MIIRERNEMPQLWMNVTCQRCGSILTLDEISDITAEEYSYRLTGMVDDPSPDPIVREMSYYYTCSVCGMKNSINNSIPENIKEEVDRKNMIAEFVAGLICFAIIAVEVVVILKLGGIF